jgi:hypothetical protein
VFCIRKRQRGVTAVTAPPVRKVKKPALRREQARERLRQLTNVADVTNATVNGEKKIEEDAQERREDVAVGNVNADSASIAEREWYVEASSCSNVRYITDFNQRNMSKHTARTFTTRTRPPTTHINIPNRH